MRLLCALAALCCLCVIITGVSATDADHAEHTYFRPQSMITTSDTSTEENIPGLAPTKMKAVKRAVPNVEQLAPVITLLAPLLPDFYKLFNAMGWYLSPAWHLAGTGPTGDWLLDVVKAFIHAFLGVGPRPPLASTLLVAAPEAYKKFPGQVVQYGQLKLPLSPVKAKMVALLVGDQIARNMLLLEAPLLSSAPDGTTVETMAGVKLTLVTKDDGRYLVSNTTSSKLLSKDIRFGPHTIVIVDSFVVPKFSTTVPKPTAWLTDEERQRIPEVMQAYRKAFEDLPQAIFEMPGAWNQMLREQMPEKLLKIIDKVTYKPVTVNVKFVDKLPDKGPKVSLNIVKP